MGIATLSMVARMKTPQAPRVLRTAIQAENFRKSFVLAGKKILYVTLEWVENVVSRYNRGVQSALFRSGSVSSVSVISFGLCRWSAFYRPGSSV